MMSGERETLPKVLFLILIDYLFVKQLASPPPLPPVIEIGKDGSTKISFLYLGLMLRSNISERGIPFSHPTKVSFFFFLERKRRYFLLLKRKPVYKSLSYVTSV